MGIKRYILLALVYMLGVGLYVYSFNGESFSLELLGLTLKLPIAVWIVIPVLLIVIASIAHLVFYNFKDFLYKRAIKKDFELLKELAKRKILEESTDDITFRTEGYKLAGKVISAMRYRSECNVDFSNEEELHKACETVQRIHSGNYEDIKKLKLQKNNPLAIENSMNRLKTEPKYAIEVLKSCQDITSPLCAKAYDTLLEFASFAEIKKYNFTPDKRTFRRMMERYLDENDSFEMDLPSIEKMLEMFNADRADYLELAQEIKIKLTPDALIALFEKLYNTKGNLAADAYLYVLYDLQMIDKVKDILENSDPDEFVKFKTVMFLREHGRSIDIDKFLRV